MTVLTAQLREQVLFRGKHFVVASQVIIVAVGTELLDLEHNDDYLLVLAMVCVHSDTAWQGNHAALKMDTFHCQLSRSVATVCVHMHEVRNSPACTANGISTLSHLLRVVQSNVWEVAIAKGTGYDLAGVPQSQRVVAARLPQGIGEGGAIRWQGKVAGREHQTGI